MTTRVVSLMPRFTSAAAVVTLALAIAACATNPVTGKREVSLMSEAQEIAVGQQADAEIRREMGVYDDPELQRYVAGIGDRLAKLSHRPHLPWTFTVVDQPAINAFALPGGYIYITRGILAHLESEAELAGVLGHEIGHVTARHSAQQYTRATGGQLGLLALEIFVPGARPFGDLASTALGVAFLKYGRDDERESDRLGMEYAAKATWDPRAVPRFLSTLARIDEQSERGVPNWLSTHPEPGARVEETRPLAAKLVADGASVEQRRDEYLRRIDGIIVGDNPREGVVRGHRFLHPDLRFAIDFPEGWEVMNSPTQVAAREPGQPHFMLLQHIDQPRSGDVTVIARQTMSGAGFRPLDGGRAVDINGLRAHIGTYTGTIQGIGTVVMRAAHVANGRQVYLIAGFAPADRIDAVRREIDAALDSYRPLSAREADEIQPNRLDFYTVRNGDSWQSIAARGGALVKATELAIMNGSPVNEQPQPGTRIKVVVAG